MFRLHNLSLACAVLALPLCTGIVQAATTTPLTLSATSVALPSYQKGSAEVSGYTQTPQTVTVSTALTASTFFSVSSSSIPTWLTVDTMSGSVNAATVTPANAAVTATLSFTVNTDVCEALGAGTYSGTVLLVVSGYDNAKIPVTLQIQNATATLSFKNGSTTLADTDTYTATYSVGAAAPTFALSVYSSGEPISFSAVAAPGSGDSSWVSLKSGSTTALTTTGVAYNFGTTVNIVGTPSVFLTAVSGTVFTGTLKITANSITTTLNLQVTVVPAVPVVSTLTPSSIPNAVGAYTVIVSGSNFVTSASSYPTTVWVNTSGGYVAGATAGIAIKSILNSSTMLLTVTNATGSALTTAGSYLIGVCNPTETVNCTAPTGTPTVALTSTAAPIIQSITSSSSYAQVDTGSNPKVAPYDVISIFGKNFLGGATDTVVGAPDATYSIFPKTLTTTSTSKSLSVDFQPVADATTSLGAGHLLFATDSQINVLVPAGIVSYTASGATTATSLIGTGKAQVVVTFDSAASAAYTLDVAAVNPGVYTLASNGQGQGAILNSDYSVNSADNPVEVGKTVMVYMTGLGAPTSTASNVTSTTAIAYPKSCIAAIGVSKTSIVGYLDSLNASSAGVLTGTPSAGSTSGTNSNLDGAVIQSALIVSPSYHYAPCVSGVTATIGAKAATVVYAGWVSDSVVGLYQVNLTIPTGIATTAYTAATSGAAVAVPVLVTYSSVVSQTGVTLYVKKP